MVVCIAVNNIFCQNHQSMHNICTFPGLLLLRIVVDGPDCILYIVRIALADVVDRYSENMGTYSTVAGIPTLVAIMWIYLLSLSSIRIVQGRRRPPRMVMSPDYPIWTPLTILSVTLWTGIQSAKLGASAVDVLFDITGLNSLYRLGCFVDHFLCISIPGSIILESMSPFRGEYHYALSPDIALKLTVLL